MIFMKYVWASWSNVSRQFSAAEKTNVKTRRITGYGRAVTFSSTSVVWSSVHATYALNCRGFETTISRG